MKLKTMFMFVMIALPCSYLAQPINDLCDNASVISPILGAVFSTMNAGTDGPDQPGSDCDNSGSSNLYNDIWYNYTAGMDGLATFSTCSTANFDTRVAVYPNLCTPLESDLISCNDDGDNCSNFTSELTWDISAGTTYKIRLGGFGPMDMGNGTFDLIEFPFPFARLQLIHNSADWGAAIVDFRINGNFIDGTMNNLQFRKSTPYMYVPADTILHITMNLPNSTNDNSPMYFEDLILDSAETYIIIVDGIFSNSGYSPDNTIAPFNFKLIPLARENAMIPGNTDILFYHGSTDTPPLDMDELLIPAPGIVDSLAFDNFLGYLELPNADYIINLLENDGSVLLDTYGLPLGSLSLEDKGIVLLANGFRYPAMNSNGLAFGLYLAKPQGGNLIPLEIQPQNDNACNPIMLPVNGNFTFFNNEGANPELNEVMPPPGDCGADFMSWCGNNAVEHSIWFTFNAPASGQVLVSTCSGATILDTQIAVWEVGDCADFSTYNMIGANDDKVGECDSGNPFSSELPLCFLHPGQTYYLQVDGWNGDQGDFEVAIFDSLTCPTARLQVIHGSADLMLETIDFRIRGEFVIPELDNLEYVGNLDATPFFTVPAELPIAITVNEINSTSGSDPLYVDTLSFAADSTYILVTRGILSESGYDPPATAVPFGYSIFDMGREENLTPDSADVLFYNALTDVTEFFYHVLGLGTTIEMDFGSFFGYLGFDESEIMLENSTSTDDLLCDQNAGPTTILVSGFHSPSSNSNGPFVNFHFVNPSGIVEAISYCTGIAETNVDEFKIFPNPTTNRLSIQSTSLNGEPLDINITDLQGRVVLAFDEIYFSSSEQILEIDVSLLDNGLYSLQILSNRKESSKLFIINR